MKTIFSPSKTIKSRYSIKNINSKYYSTNVITVNNSTGKNGYVYIPYIFCETIHLEDYYKNKLIQAKRESQLKDLLD